VGPVGTSLFVCFLRGLCSEQSLSRQKILLRPLLKCTCTNRDTARGGGVTYNFVSLYGPILFSAALGVPGRPGHQSFLSVCPSVFFKDIVAENRRAFMGPKEGGGIQN